MLPVRLRSKATFAKDLVNDYMKIRVERENEQCQRLVKQSDIDDEVEPYQSVRLGGSKNLVQLDLPAQMGVLWNHDEITRDTFH
jgi:hypothetical protein